MLQLTDLIEEPVNLYDPHFQQKITADKQFSSLNYDIPKITRGQLFPHQEFNRRFLRLYPSLIIIDEAGTGKTCAVTGFAEYAFDEYLLSKQNNFLADQRVANLRRTVLLVKGKTQENEFRNQLLCNCTTRYEKILKERDLENNNKDKSESSKKSAITSVISNWYDVYGYHKFTNYILKKYPEFLTNMEQQNKAAAEYDDTIFWIDEAHNLINVTKEIKVDKLDKNTVYAVISIILQKAKRTKIIISTATPATNNVEDFTSVFNLALPPNHILPEEFDLNMVSILDLIIHLPQVAASYLPNYDLTDPWKIVSTYAEEITRLLQPMRMLSRESVTPYFIGQIPINYDYSKANLPVLNCYLRGRVTYVRAIDSAVQVKNMVNPDYHGPLFPNLKLQLFYSTMSDFQTNYYNTAYVQSSSNTDGVYNSSRQASIMVYPDGSWGDNITSSNKKIKQVESSSTELARQNELYTNNNINEHKIGYRKYITVDKNLNIKVNNSLRELIPNLEAIKNYSIIYYEIIKNILITKGNVFVYADDMVYGSGIIALAAFLEIAGYERMREKSSIFVQDNNEEEKNIYCAPIDPVKRKNRKIREDFIPKKRYAILTGETSNDFSIIMEAMNSYANKNGDYIQVLITSRVGRDGINVYNVLSIHIIPFAWNYAAVYQSLMRSLRITSHYDLMEHINSIIETGVYLHAAIPNNYIMVNNMLVNRLPQIEPINVNMYVVSEQKDIKIKRIMRMIKQLAVSCQINLARNIRPAIYDNTPLCDYQSCEYSCLEISPEQYNYHNYDILYAEQNINNTIDNLRIIFAQYSVRTYTQLVENLTAINVQHIRYLLYALEQIILQRMELLNNYGFSRYLHNQGDLYFLSENYPSKESDQISNIWYDNHLTALQYKSFNKVVYEQNITQYNKVIEVLRSSNNISDLLNRLNVDLQVYILEQAILQVINNIKEPYNESILDHYKQYWYFSHEPYSELIKSANAIAEIHLKSGQKAVEQFLRAKSYSPELLNSFVVEDNTEIVYWHNLYLLTPNQAKYANTSQFNKGAGRIRILKRSDSVYNIYWRDALDYEYPVYNLLIQRVIKQKQEEFRKHKLYATILNGEFKIIDIENEKERKNMKDNRYKATGRVCSSWSKFQLYNFLYRLNYPIIINNYENNRDILIYNISTKVKGAINLDTYSTDHLIYLNNLSIDNPESKTLCSMLYKRFAELNLIFT